jgi:hypothetical protein
MEGNPKVTENNWGKGIQGKGVNEKTKSFSKLNQPVPYAQIKTETAEDAFKSVLRSSGASHRRDAVDKRIVDETRTGQEQFGTTFSGGKKGIIDSPEDVGGWPVLKQEKVPADSDNDGIPDEWETSNGLNPNDSSDGNAITLDKNYTNLEVYLNSLVEHIIQ